MGGVHFLNLEYILTRAFDFGQGVHAGDIFAHVPTWATFLATEVAIWGMILTLILVVFITYVRIRLVMVEHAGFHALEEHHTPEAEAEVVHGSNQRWEHIMGLASSADPGNWRRAILEADIMLGVALDAAGYSGNSVGEQLKIVNPLQLTTLRLAWDAHMLRNKVAHQGEALALTERDVRTAIDHYRRVFDELGAI